jgi:hypothetical protein
MQNGSGAPTIHGLLPPSSANWTRDCDHLPWIGESDRLLDEVEEFLTGVRRGPDPDRVLATVLFTDIVGSTERAAALGGWALARTARGPSCDRARAARPLARARDRYQR